MGDNPSPKSPDAEHHASYSPDTLDRIADLVVAKLTALNAFSLLPKHDVAGSNPVTRSNYFLGGENASDSRYHPRVQRSRSRR